MKKLLILGMTVLILSMLVIGCEDDDGKEFYAVYYSINSSTQSTLDSSYKNNFSTATLAFVKDQGSNLVAEKRGTAEEVVAFLNSLFLNPSLSSVMPIPTVTQIEAADVGAYAGWWPKNGNYFVYIERSK